MVWGDLDPHVGRHPRTVRALAALASPCTYPQTSRAKRVDSGDTLSSNPKCFPHELRDFDQLIQPLDRSIP